MVNLLENALHFARTLEMVGMGFSFSLHRLNAIQKSSNAYLPGLEDAIVIEIWRDLRLCTSDGLPIISRSDYFENLVIAAGHAMSRMSLEPVTGTLVSQLVAGEKTDLDVNPFNVIDFKSKVLLNS